MKLQRKDERNCGQRCLAFILGITIQESIDLVGHNKPTKSKEIILHFNSSNNKRGYPKNDALCIMRWKDKKKGSWHWIVKKEDYIYDPCVGIITESHFLKEFDNCVITSHFEIL